MQNQFLGLESKPAVQFFSFSVPAVLGMLLTSGIIIVDGLFIGNCIGRAGLASVNLTLPVIYLFMGVTIMIGVGGSVKAGHALGAGMQDRAGQWFSLTTALAAGVVGALTAVCFILFDPLINLLNTDPGLHIFLKTYLKTILVFYPAMMMNIVFSIFLRTQGRPGLSLVFGLAGNALNIVLDYVMIARLGMGLRGAALASGFSVTVPMCCGILWFIRGRSALRFRAFTWHFGDAGQLFLNGSSEMIGQISIGITTWVFNRVMLARIGIDGLAAYTIAGYAAFVQFMIITGFAIGLAPIVGYSFGARKTAHIKTVMRIALFSGAVTGFLCWMVVLFSATGIAALFSPGNPHIIFLAQSGFGLFAAAFWFNGFNILITAYFTALGNAGISAAIAVLRGFVLINIFVVSLPRVMGDAGIWLSYPLAEIVTLFFALAWLRQSFRSLEANSATAYESMRA